MAYKGRYYPKNPQKYKGDASNIVFRSGWEARVMKWLDLNPDVVKWSSEELFVTYICKTDGKMHRYFPDFLIEFSNGKKLLVEVKPLHQTKPPKKTKKKNDVTFLNEVMTFAKNESKWQAAQEWSKKHGYIFQIWSEPLLESIGIVTRFDMRKSHG